METGLPKAPTRQLHANGKPVMALRLALANGAGGNEMHGSITKCGLQPPVIKAGKAPEILSCETSEPVLSRETGPATKSLLDNRFRW